MITVAGAASSINVRKVLWTCARLGLRVEHPDAPSGGVLSDKPALIAMNPNGLAPVICDGDFILWESNTIIRYLASQYGGAALYPQEPRQRARIDQWIDWQASDLNKSWSYAFMALVRQSAAHQDVAHIAASTAAWVAHMTVLDKQLEKTGAHVAGSAFTLADIPIGLSVHRWFSTPLRHPILPAVSAYYDLLVQCAGYRAYGRNGVP